MTGHAGGDLTDDGMLGGRLRILQPAKGHRASIDAVLLAAAIPAVAGEMALEGGAGVGTASLCLARRVAGLSVDALEIDPELAALAQQNAERNGLGDAIEVYCGDINSPPYRITPNSYHHVFMNPPFLRPDTNNLPAQAGRAAARMEGGASLRDWIKFAVSMARPSGCITLIHRVDRLDDVLAALKGRAGGCEIFPLWPGGGKPAKLFLLRAYKGNEAPLSLLPGLVLHEAGTKYSGAAEEVLRHGGALHFAA